MFFPEVTRQGHDANLRKVANNSTSISLSPSIAMPLKFPVHIGNDFITTGRIFIGSHGHSNSAARAALVSLKYQSHMGSLGVHEFSASQVSSFRSHPPSLYSLGFLSLLSHSAPTLASPAAAACTPGSCTPLPPRGVTGMGGAD